MSIDIRLKVLLGMLVVATIGWVGWSMINGGKAGYSSEVSSVESRQILPSAIHLEPELVASAEPQRGLYEHLDDAPEEIPPTGEMKKIRTKDGCLLLYDKEGRLIREDLPDGKVRLHSFTESGKRISEIINCLFRQISGRFGPKASFVDVSCSGSLHLRRERSRLPAAIAEGPLWGDRYCEDKS